MNKVIFCTFLLSLSTYSFYKPDPKRWAKETKNISQCYYLADQVSPQPQKENRFLTCIEVHGADLTQRQCHFITRIDYFKGRTRQDMAFAYCLKQIVVDQEPTYEPRESDQDSEQNSETPYRYDTSNQ